MTAAELSERVRNPQASTILRNAGEPVSAALALRFCECAQRTLRLDLPAAAALAEAAAVVARHAADPRALAEAWRMRGHVYHLTGQNRRAVNAYARAVRLLEQLGAAVDAGRTRSSALQSLIYLGEYSEALDWARRARLVFEQEGDSLRLARLDSNEANILHRQDRYPEALALYRRAIAGLEREGDRESLAIALRNMAVCHTAVYDFDQALVCYRRAEAIYRERRLVHLAAEIGDNIGQLHYLRGDYMQALDAYRQSQPESRVNSYQAAVAQLDQSELLLELNLFSEAAARATDSIRRLSRRGFRYERAKGTLILALAEFRQGDSSRALRSLARARGLFAREGSAAWEAAADFYRGAFLLDLGDLAGAAAVTLDALRRLEHQPLLVHSLAALLLQSRIESAAGRTGAARTFYERAVALSRDANTLPVQFQLAVRAGQIHDEANEPQQAAAAYRQACEIADSLRGQFGGDGLRISFLTDKAECYSRLAALEIQRTGSAAQALELVERAKSRSLADALIQGADGIPAHESPQVQALRQQLSWCYRQVDRQSPSVRSGSWREQIEQLERRLSSEWAIGHAVPAAEPSGTAFELARLQALLPEGDSLIEYFADRGQLFGFVVNRSRVAMTSLGPFEAVERVCRRLRFQMSRGLWAKLLVARDDPQWLAGTIHHLARLHELLITPLRPWLGDAHWTIVPHGVLHRVPFHALYDGSTFVLDRQTLSYAPSAAVFCLCATRLNRESAAAAVFAAPDDRAPHILDEGEAVARLIPGAKAFLGASATLSNWTAESSTRQVLHLATHGLFREDNPLFSSLRLSDGRLCLYDLYRMRLSAALVTLSGCATGAHEAEGGDEVVGLTRGLLIAGARAAQVALWEVDDQAALDYMRTFYRRLLGGHSMAEAGRQAALEVRRATPHPFYWAPFILHGDAKKTLSPISNGHETHPLQRNRP